MIVLTLLRRINNKHDGDVIIVKEISSQLKGRGGEDGARNRMD